MYIQNPEKRKGCVACIRQTSVRNWYKSLKGKAKLQTGLCMCMLLSLHLRKSQSKTPLWDALGWKERERERESEWVSERERERERERKGGREICDLLPSDLHSHKQFPLLWGYAAMPLPSETMACYGMRNEFLDHTASFEQSHRCKNSLNLTN